MTYFCGKLGMTPAEAAILLGVVLDLTISEVPDLPNKVVMGMVPLSVFQGDVLP
jgi:acetamidase/formamidase